MKVGDLVWHVDDLKDGVVVPGLIVEIHLFDSTTHLSPPPEAVVLFGDRTFNEYHTIDELTHHPVLHEDENIMGNP